MNDIALTSRLSAPMAPISAAATTSAPQRDFASILQSTQHDDASGQQGTFDEETARTAAQQFVSSALVLPILQQVREGAQAEGPFAPSDAERRFAPLLDEKFADRITKAANFPLIDAIVDRLHQSGGAKTRTVSTEGARR